MTSTNTEALRAALAALPTGVSQVYEIALRRIVEQTKLRTSGIHVMGIVLHSRRRLLVSELNHALGVKGGGGPFIPAAVPKVFDFAQETCGLLAVRNGEVYLVHHSIADYCHKPEVHDRYFEDMEKKMANICLSYITFDGFSEPYCTDCMVQRYKDYPLLDYAIWHLGYHSSMRLKSHVDDSILQDLLQLLKNRNKIPLGSLQVVAAKVLQNPHPNRIQSWQEALPDLHLAIAWNLEAVVAYLISSNAASLDEPAGTKNETPLHLAARSANISAIEQLINRNVNINATNYSGKNALDMIINRPWLGMQLRMHEPQGPHLTLALWLLLRFLPEIVKTKIDQTAKEVGETAKRDCPSPQAEDSLDKSRKNTAILLQAGPDVDITDDEESSCLLLIKHGIDVNSEYNRHTMSSPLQLAVIYKRLKIVKALLKTNANPFVKGEIGWTAMDLAEQRGDKEIIECIKRRCNELRRMEDSLPSEEDKLSKLSIRICGIHSSVY